jgi:DNA polymerase-3 subunit gamma/tau
VSYLVLARKYRPQRFSELVGQEHVSRTLSNAIAQNRVHHAFLFTGARGVGKTSAARILAKALSCEKGPTAEPCGVCDICQEIAAGRSVDVIEIDAASNTKVEETKSVLEGVRYLPARARRKVYIIDEVHMLSAHSWNALLKTLEEPPPHVVFVFATTEVHKIPGTILSRCQRFDFKLISTVRLTTHLEEILKTEKIAAAPEAIRLIARQAAGSVRDALSLLDQAIAYVGEESLSAEVAADVLGIADRRLLVELAAAVLDRDAGAALRLVARAADRGVDLGELGRSFLAFLRDLEVVARVKEQSGVGYGDLIDATPEEIEEAKALASRVPAGLVPVLFERWARAVDEASRMQTPRLLFEMAAVELCAAEPLLPLGDLLQRLDELEVRLRGGGPRPGPGSPGDATPPQPKPAAGPKSWGTPAAAPARPPSPPKSAAMETVEPPPAPAAKPASAPSAVEPPKPATAPPPVPAVSAPASRGPGELWSGVLAGFEAKRPRIAALLSHAQVVALTGGLMTLALPDKFTAEQAERHRADIEAAVAEAAGAPTRLAFTVGARLDATVKSVVGAEADANAADRKHREQEARQHPLIRSVQDVFGAALKEIKT